MKTPYKLLSLLGVSMLLGHSSCTKDVVEPSGEDPYQENIQPQISLASQGLSPDRGTMGGSILVRGRGFEKVKDKLVLMFNEQPAEVGDVTDTTLVAKVPQWAATGNVGVQVDREHTFGPLFRMFGPLQIDTVFPGFRGADNAIYDIIPVEGDKFLIGGSFGNYDNANISGGINRLARINANGTIDRAFQYGEGTGTLGGGVNNIIVLSDGKLLVAGGFSSYANTPMVQGIARLHPDGSLDKVNITLNSGAVREVPALKGGISGAMGKVYVQQDHKIIVTGNFRYYVEPDYYLTASTGTDSVHLDSTLVNSLIRLNADGSLDTTYNYDLENQRGKPGLNGYISATFLQPDDKLIVAGNFTRYNGQAVPGFIRLDTDGNIDPSFNPGSGPNQYIGAIVPTGDGKFIIGGNFTRYNEQAAPRIARIHADGSLDGDFEVSKGPDDYINNISIMPQGEIIVTGPFKKFGDVTRNGFAVLNPDGSLHESYNTNGGLISYEYIYKILQLPEQKAMIAVGSFTEFDERPNFRIMRINYE